jgi:hypothetical protein
MIKTADSIPSAPIAAYRYQEFSALSGYSAEVGFAEVGVSVSVGTGLLVTSVGAGVMVGLAVGFGVFVGVIVDEEG